MAGELRETTRARLEGRALKLRAVGAQDDAFLLDSASAAPAGRATRLLARCLLGGEALAGALTMGEREALLLQLRRLTFGDTLDCTLRCPRAACGERLDLRLSVSDLLLSSTGAPDTVAGTYELACEAEGSHFELVFRLPNADDLELAARPGLDASGGALAILERCVQTARRDGVTVPAATLPAEVRTAVAAAMRAHDPQAEVQLEMSCPACGEPFSSLFDTGAYFLRELDARAVRTLRDVHTLALHYHWSEADILALPAERRAHYLGLLGATPARGAAS